MISTAELDGLAVGLGIVAAILIASSALPQIKRGIATRSMEDVSVYLVVLLISGFSMWTFYGILRDDWVIIGANVVNTSLNTILLFLKIKYSKSLRT